MKRPTNQSITRWLIFDFVRRNRHAFALVFVLAAVLGVFFTNEPVSSRVIEGRFVRWTVVQGQDRGLPVAYIDLPDGRTVAAQAWVGWTPPAAGSMIRVQEFTLLWFGQNYHVAPA